MLNDILIGTRSFLKVGALTGTGVGLTFLGRIAYYSVLDVTKKAHDTFGQSDTTNANEDASKYSHEGSYIKCGKWMIATFAAGAICTKLAYASTRLPKSFTTQTVLDSLRITDWTEYFPAVVSKY